MDSFHMVDLYSQMPYLPQRMRGWPQERVLAWMRLFGEVWQMDRSKAPSFRRMTDSGALSNQSHTYYFRSWIGCELIFEYPAPGEMYKVGDLRRGWSSYAPPEGADDC